MGRLKTARNTLVAMTLSGLWHGAAWHFVFWGLWHGVGPRGRALVARGRSDGCGTRCRDSTVSCVIRASHVVGYGFGMVVTFNYVALGWVLFATGLRASLVVYERLYAYLVAPIADKVLGRLL